MLLGGFEDAQYTHHRPKIQFLVELYPSCFNAFLHYKDRENWGDRSCSSFLNVNLHWGVGGCGAPTDTPARQSENDVFPRTRVKDLLGIRASHEFPKYPFLVSDTH